MGFFRCCGKPFMMSHPECIPDENRSVYLKLTGIVDIVFAFFVYIMAIIEKLALLQISTFVCCYIFVTALFIIVLLYINKKLLHKLLP